MKAKFIYGDTIHGVRQVFEITEANNQFLIGREIYTQNIDKKFFIGFKNTVPFNSTEEFSRSLNEKTLELTKTK